MGKLRNQMNQRMKERMSCGKKTMCMVHKPTVDISSHSGFVRSLKELKKGGYTMREVKQIVVAQNMAKAQLGRQNLSCKERTQFMRIANARTPRPTR